MTDKETQVFRRLVEARNAFLELQTTDLQERAKFMGFINDAQALLMARPSMSTMTVIDVLNSGKES